jgi:hypothetical protein
MMRIFPLKPVDMQREIRHLVASARTRRRLAVKESTNRPRSRQNQRSEEKHHDGYQEESRQETRSKEKDSSEAQAKRSFHEADDPERGPCGSDRRRPDAAHRSDQEDLGLHQEEQPAGQEEPPQHQCRPSWSASTSSNPQFPH